MKDNFSKQASLYAKYRPLYPQAIFDFILGHIQNKHCAWDCATGNGQTAKELANYFTQVFATDISQKQLDNAVHATNIIYSLQLAEQTHFKQDQFDLVTVSQALHWFNFEKFYTEVNRVTKPGGWIAVWMYGGITISPEIDQIKQDYYSNTLGPYWDTERKWVDDDYAGIPFPFQEIECPIFSIRYEWTMNELEGYLNTWSALQKYILAKNDNPVGPLMKAIGKHWEEGKRKITFPLHLRMGRIAK